MGTAWTEAVERHDDWREMVDSSADAADEREDVEGENAEGSEYGFGCWFGQGLGEDRGEGLGEEAAKLGGEGWGESEAGDWGGSKLSVGGIGLVIR